VAKFRIKLLKLIKFDLETKKKSDILVNLKIKYKLGTLIVDRQIIRVAGIV
jgi:hypothetical protein